MPTRRVLLQETVLNASAATVTFSNIPQTYSHLFVDVSARGDRSATLDGMHILFNGSTSNRNNRSFYTSGSVNGTSGNDGILYAGTIPAATGTSNAFSASRVWIPNYTSNLRKTYLSLSAEERAVTSSKYIYNVTGTWSDSSAITSITLDLEYGNFVSNSTFYLYGITHIPIIRGGEVSIANGYKTHVFKSTSSIQVVEGGEVEFLVIAGGGPGGYGNNGYLSGGGGAGGYRSSIIGESSGGGALSEPKARLDPGKHVITVGAGGSSTSNGSPSSIGSVISTVGGGRGGSSSTYGLNGLAGGSGGGGSTASGVGGAGTSGQGYAGGNGRSGGGGGQGGGAGDTGSLRAFNGRVSAATGSQVAYASGGIDYNAIPGDPNTGNGGTGSGSTSSNYAWGGNGGSGIVVIRYPYDGN